MSDREELENQGFKIQDRRRFQSDGTPVEGTVSEGQDSGTTPEAPKSEAAGEARPSRSELPADFSSLVLSIAAGAHSALGLVPHPMTGKLEKNLSQAKYSIDLLGMLEAKTKGNLETEEAKLLEAILYDLRLRYVEAKPS